MRAFNTCFLIVLYQNLFGRPAEGGGLAYWTQVSSGNSNMSSQSVIEAIRASTSGTSTSSDVLINQQLSANPVSSDSVPQPILDFITDASNSLSSGPMAGLACRRRS